MRIFKPNILMHIEDHPRWIEGFYDFVVEHESMEKVYGGSLSHVLSDVSDELSQEDLEREVSRLDSESGDGPSLISIVSGQVAREYIAKFLPGAIVSDTGFPLNGATTVRWLKQHGLENYPLIGLSGTRLDLLDDDIREYFLTTNARYFTKAPFEPDKIRPQVIYNRGYLIENLSLVDPSAKRL